jgi:hypothetical protein
VIIRFEDRDWEYDPGSDMDVQEAVAIHLTYGMTVADWTTGLKQLDARSWQVVYWLMLRRNGVTRAIKDCSFPLIAFVTAYTDAARAARQGLEDVPDEVDPTNPPLPSRPAVPPSPGPSSRPDTTPPPPVPPPPVPPPPASTGYSPSPFPGSAASTYSASPGSAT